MYSSKEIRSFTAVELGKKIADKEITSVQATNAYLEQIENTEKDVNAYITVMKEKALERADFIDKKIAEGEIWSNLMGVPMAIKDVLCMKDTLTSCGSKILGNFYPTYTSTAVENLLNAGVVVLGKTNMDEFVKASGGINSTSYSFDVPSQYCCGIFVCNINGAGNAVGCFVCNAGTVTLNFWGGTSQILTASYANNKITFTKSAGNTIQRCVAEA